MAISGLNILFASAHFPYPLIGGERIKQYYILKHLAASNNVHLVSFDRGYSVDEDCLRELRNINVTPHLVKLNLLKSYLSAALFSPFGKPLEIEFFRDNKFKKIVSEIIGNSNIDLSVNYFIRTSEYIRHLPGKKLLLAEDCRSYYQSRTFKISKSALQKAIRGYDTRKLKKFEAGLMNDFDITTVVTDEDREQMRNLNPMADVRILTNGVDTEKFHPPENGEARGDLLFVGKLNVWINILMLRRIVSNILPEIKKLNPGCRLHIVGGCPAPEILKMQSEDIILHADVEDIVPYLQKAAVFIHPHEGGSGIQNKVLEAMACGCPVLTTHSGARGIDIQSGKNGFICEDDYDFAITASKVLNSSDLQCEIGLNARKHIELFHTWERIFIELDNILVSLLN